MDKPTNGSLQQQPSIVIELKKVNDSYQYDRQYCRERKQSNAGAENF